MQSTLLFSLPCTASSGKLGEVLKQSYSKPVHCSNFLLETVYPHCFKSCMIGHMTAHTTGKVVKDRIGPGIQKKQCTPTLFPHLTDGRKSGLHSFFFPLQYGGNLKVYPLFFSHCHKMEKKSVPPTLFFPT